MIEYCGIKIYTSELLTEKKEWWDDVPMTFRERWIDPILHPVTIPFEPWRTTKRVLKVMEVPSEKILHLPDGFVMHPDKLKQFKEQFAQLNRGSRP